MLSGEERREKGGLFWRLDSGSRERAKEKLERQERKSSSEKTLRKGVD